MFSFYNQNSLKIKKIAQYSSFVFLFFAVIATVYALNFHQTYKSKASGLTTTPTSNLSYTITKVLGQPDTKETMVNEITADRGFHLGGAHVDSSGHVYVFDSGNNRILGFSSYSADRAPDIVIGQTKSTDKGSANGDNTVYANPTAATLALLPYPEVISTLESPRSEQMASDADGNLYVVDLNNNRVLKYISPFTTDQVADEVWGQPDFTSRGPHCGQSGLVPSASTFCTEWGNSFNGMINQVFMSAVEIDGSGNLWVADTGNNRLLRFSKNGDGTISKVADLVLGQSDFVSNTGSSGFDSSLNKISKPISIKFNSTSGELYVLEGELAGQARISVFTPPFTNGMVASREIGRAVFQDNQPSDTTNWENISGKWVHVTTGIYWPRGMNFDVGQNGLWINDTGNQRVVYINLNGQLTDVIGQPNIDTKGCLGLSTQGYIGNNGSKYNICDPEGEIGVSSDGHLFITNIGGADPKSLTRFISPVQRNSDLLPISDGQLLFNGINKYSGKTFYNGYGMALSDISPQLLVSDRQRVMVWNNATSAATFSQANYVIGQDTFTDNANNNGGVFNAIDLGGQTVGGGYAWISSGDRIFAFQLPITSGGKNYVPVKVLYTGSYSNGNVFWADDGSKVPFNAHGIAYDKNTGALWVSDYDNNRVFRIANPLGNAIVDIVLGQPNKTSICDNGCLAGENAKSFSDAWAVQFDKLGNLYVVDSKYEGGSNNRVLRFNVSKLTPQTGNIFPFPDADGVYAKQDFTSNNSWGSGTPQTPIWVTFDSANRMLMLVDGYGNTQYQRVFIYTSTHASEVAPQPSYVLPIPISQGATAFYYPDDSHLIIQDHTWDRILFVTLNNFPVFSPTPSLLPSPSSVPTKSPSPKPTPTRSPSPKPTASPKPTPTKSPSPTPKDTTRPVVKITYPINAGRVGRSTTVNITATATDNISVKNVSFYVNSSLICTDNSAPYSCSWKVPTSRNVKYTIQVNATDPTGNIGTASVSVTSQ